MLQKIGDVQKLDMKFTSLKLRNFSRTLRSLTQLREVWLVRGWGFHVSRERTETTVQLTDHSNARD
jgi:hypothetical protein